MCPQKVSRFLGSLHPDVDILIVLPALPGAQPEAGCQNEAHPQADVHNGCDEDKEVDLVQGCAADGRPIVWPVLALLPASLNSAIALDLQSSCSIKALQS